jgi:hypothetical protein
MLQLTRSRCFREKEFDIDTRFFDRAAATPAFAPQDIVPYMRHYVGLYADVY